MPKGQRLDPKPFESARPTLDQSSPAHSHPSLKGRTQTKHSLQSPHISSTHKRTQTRDIKHANIWDEMEKGWGEGCLSRMLWPTHGMGWMGERRKDAQSLQTRTIRHTPCSTLLYSTLLFTISTIYNIT